MKTKLFEIRDRATFIAAIATKIDSDNEAERYLLRRSGFHTLPSDLVFFCRLDGAEQLHYDHYHRSTAVRTMSVAHKFVARHFDDLETGAVIDVEFILGERRTSKLSERFTS